MVNAFKQMNADGNSVVKAAAVEAGQQAMKVTVEGDGGKWLSTKPLVSLGAGLALGALGVVAYNRFSK